MLINMGFAVARGGLTVDLLCSQANIALFEAHCKEKIQQFEDAGSDEEDIWDEKDVTFAPESQRRPRSADARPRWVPLADTMGVGREDNWHCSRGGGADEGESKGDAVDV